MVSINVYVKYEIERELIAIAEKRNENLDKGKKQIRPSTVISEILDEWYKKRKGGK